MNELAIIGGIALGTALLTAIAASRVGFLIGKTHGFLEGQSSIINPIIDRVAKGEEEITVGIYQATSLRTWYGPMPGTVHGFNHLAFKLAGETGEFMEHVGKALRDDPGTLEDFHNGFVKFTPERRKALLKELGDVLWYITVLAKELNSSLIEVMAMNVIKLRDRHARGKMKGSGDDR